eukprot:TRINITY_DN6279_c0_g1_i2.p1 TRINITY_DN6279_c0_g1~~TRINITY_DN6279_c0_g1_i2.p1  ORF type:complete len:1093 (-),score=167.02 TRINITY_DN6279_c0_g1_i2:76-3354(-)
MGYLYNYYCNFRKLIELQLEEEIDFQTKNSLTETRQKSSRPLRKTKRKNKRSKKNQQEQPLNLKDRRNSDQDSSSNGPPKSKKKGRPITVSTLTRPARRYVDIPTEVSRGLVESTKRMLDYTLMEMILRSCKTILQKRLRKMADSQVIPDLASLERITYGFHLETSDRNSPFWKSEVLYDTIRMKFGELSNITEGSNILNLLIGKENPKKLISLIPTYCHYNEGIFIFEIENKMVCKSSVPELEAQYVIERILEKPNVDLRHYWNKYREIGVPAEVLLALAVPCSQKYTDNQDFLDIITHRSLRKKRTREEREQIAFKGSHVVSSGWTVSVRNYEIKRNRETVLMNVPDEITCIKYRSTDTRENTTDIDWFFSISNLNSLDLTDSVLLTDEGLIMIAERGAHSIKSLNISGCLGITDTGISKVLSTMEELCSLDISYCMGVDKLCRSNPESELTVSKNLITLDISSCNLSYKAILVVSSLKNLQTLKMSHTQLLTDDIARDLFPNFQNLERLDVSYCFEITRASFLIMMPKIAHVNLDGTNIKSDSLHTYPPLMSMSVNYCKGITDTHFLTMSNDTIERLSLKGSGVRFTEEILVEKEKGVNHFIYPEYHTSQLEVLKVLDLTQVKCNSLHFLENLYLEELYLSDLERSTLPGKPPHLRFIAHMNLEILEMINCYFSEQDMKYIGDMKNLRRLNLSSATLNKVSSLKYLSNLVNLEEVYFEEVDVSNMDFAQNWTSVKTLGLKNSAITDNSIRNIEHLNELDGIFIFSIFPGKSLEKFAYLEHITFHSSKVTDDAILSITDKCKYITSVALYNCDALTNDSLQYISFLKKLVNLQVSRCRVDDSGFEKLVHNTNLTSINVGGLRKLVNFPFGHFTKLKSLRIDSCQNVSYDTIFGLSSLVELNTLNLNLTRFVEDKAFEGLVNCRYLTDLNLSNCHKLGSVDVCKGISFLVYLKRLLLSVTKITDEGFLHLATLQNLTELNVHLCFKLTEQGLTEISKLTNLLRLDCGEIENMTGYAIQSYTSLKNLEFISLQGCKYVGDAVKHLGSHRRLSKIDISGCGFSKTDPVVTKLQKSNPSLEIILGVPVEDLIYI